jgi:hypothetical protein
MIGTMSIPSHDFVRIWAEAYVAEMSGEETRLFEEVGPAVRVRGFYGPGEFAAVAAWKSPRSRPWIARNSADDVLDVTRLALNAPERLQHRLLLLLRGVQVPTGTALLAVAQPDRHTIFDVRSTGALRRLGLWDGGGGYVSYLEVCRTVARRRRVALRTLDRALWRWSKAEYPDP